MNDQHIKSFLLAAQEGSFSKAAALCYVSTPSFSQRIQLLEKELGFELFKRSSMGVKLTPAGELFLQTAMTLERVFEDGLARALSVARHRVRIGHISTDPFPTFFPPMINYFAKKFPEIEVVFRFAQESLWIDGVNDGLSDVCIATPPLKGDETYGNLRFVHLFDDPFLMCVSPESNLARLRSVSAIDLRGEVVYLQSSYKGHPSFHRLFALQDEGVEVTECLFNKDLIMKVFLQGQGVIPLPLQYYASCCPPLIPLNFKDATFAQGVIYRADASRVVLDFVSSLKEYFEETPLC